MVVKYPDGYFENGKWVVVNSIPKMYNELTTPPFEISASGSGGGKDSNDYETAIDFHTSFSAEPIKCNCSNDSLPLIVWPLIAIILGLLLLIASLII